MRISRSLVVGLLTILFFVGCGEDALVSGGNGTDAAQVGSDGDGQLDAGPTDGAGAAADGTATDDGKTGVDATDVGQPDVGTDTGSTTDVAAPDTTSDDAAEGCTPAQCDTADGCFDAGEVSPANPCAVCDPSVDPEGFVARAGTCDDGDACTTADACNEAGLCVGKAKACDDGNACTDDACKDGGCAGAANTAACADGDVCTVGDACKDGTCVAGAAKSCDDGNPCTTDSCDPTNGCQHAFADGAGCDDGNPCTEKDACAAGGCLGGGPANCDDGDICTVDSCAKDTGCTHKSQAALCKDDNVCTEDSCDKIKGCVYGFNDLPCDDGSVCTKGDTCAVGLCKGATVEVDDGNPCTDDSCDAKLGPLHASNTLPCQDGNACTLGDECAGGSCKAGSGVPKCDDGNACTADACSPALGCKYENLTKSCDDGTACTKDDACKAGKCVGVEIDCDDGSACSVDACDKDKGCTHTVTVSNACRPQIVIDYPPRGATIKSDLPFIAIKGKVTSGAGSITAFTINNKTVTLAKNGSFTHEVTAAIGGNTLEMHAEDVLGTKRKRVQAFLWSNSYLKPDADKPKSGMVDPGVGYFLSKEAIDDGDHSLPPNDLATIFEIFLQNYDLAGVIPNPAFEGNGIVATVKNLKVGKAKVTLVPLPGTLRLSATIPNASADVNAKWSILSLNGKLTITAIKLTADVVPKVVNHALITEVNNVVVKLEGFNLQLTGLGSLLNFLVNALEGSIAKDLETSLAKAMKDQLGPTISGALGALAFAFDIGVPKLDGSGDEVEAKLLTDFSEVIIDNTGAIFRLRSGVYAKKGNTVDNLGVPKRIGCGTGIQPLTILKQKALELALADDTLNEFLYALWFGGLLEFPVGKELLGDIDLSAYGISNLKLKTKALLAPTAADCNDQGELLAHIGDFRVDATLDIFGQKMTVVVHASFVAGIEVSVDGNKLNIKLTKIKSVATDVEVVEENLIASESVVEGLIADKLVGNLLDVLGGSALGGFELPVVDLSGAVPGIPKGTGIAIDPQTVVRKDGNTIIGGKLK
ncbi:MAG: hypothetical protein H6747_16685 [Deltaproteobacteria bacterium]|nr:hypothetical protein [Deltaproteobacteria bacterium]